ncbi:tRNA epoxyqueuosine(34) reductase QueG [Croceimicrobium hydrocarbonivorans]|uniref:Epoxyqueuosine reductase n=1 Tax=Croceimicrobium hydrocarbonivorans TaxID=2761580 RepID=A0A7H0VAV9_9FLAO|nr:tRNA epoxyqueuosine(34) reductase QueG [Croceimicrobium hydrocarbonivorans]QNR22857.1 tRNA epoxyqueuosine(34) reductase QueG [Croceimicrobium hydrocarbonivorans]
MTSKATYTRKIKEEAQRLGFVACGVAKARYLEEEAPKLESWLNQNYQGEMAWLANHFDKRLDPSKLVPGAKSVISLIFNYYPAKVQEDPQAPKIAKYAYGEDYHFVLKSKLKALVHFIQDEIGEIDGRVFVDSAPVMERKWAQEAGLGWLGKNTLLLNKKEGSFFFLAELILDLELEYDTAMQTDHCGTCTRCIDACPTDAILQPNLLDASKCISYLTIELKDSIPNEFKGKMENWAFGCDICQDVCPWNRFSKPHQEEAFNPHPDLLSMSSGDWEELSEEVFREFFRKSAVKRTKYLGLQRNLKFIRKEEG